MGAEPPVPGDVIELLPLGVWVARVPGGELVFANQAFREILGMEARADVAAGGYAEPYGICGLDGEPYPEDRMPFVQAVAAGATITVDDIVIHRHDGGRVNIRAVARPIFTDGGEISHVVIAFADITAEVEAEAARRLAEERMREHERLEALGTLAGGIAHDFNNLLASIRVLASLLRLHETDPARTCDLRQIEETTDSAARLTRALLTFGRGASGPAHRVDLAAIARRVTDLAARTFDRAITVALEVAPGNTVLTGDEAQLEQLVMNLCVNARDAMPDGGQLDVRVSGDDARVRIEVSDNGVGIDPAARDHIFEPYYTTKDASQAPCSGLGLATAYGVVKGHRGTIEAQPASPRGTRFVVSLPTTTGDTVTVADTRDHAAATSTGAAATSTGHGTVLVVEDEERLRVTTSRALEALGFRIVQAHDGISALAAITGADAALDAMLLDLQMPRMGGRELLERLPSVAPRLPVVITSGTVGADDHDALRALGARAIMAKPYDLGALAKLLSDVIAAPRPAP